MSYIKKKAEEFAINEFDYDQIPTAFITINRVQNEIRKIRDKKEIITFLTTILEKCAEYKQFHMKKCFNDMCRAEEEYDAITYYLGQELFDYGIYLNHDTFNNDESIKAKYKIDELLTEIQGLKNKHSDLVKSYDAVIEELSQLKEILYIGKKHWHLLLTGIFKQMNKENLINEETEQRFNSIINPSVTNYFTINNYGSINTLNQGETINL